jgi:hypothetical protein
MTIEIRKNDPVPQPPPPPTTYDIFGLSYGQAALIRDLLGTMTRGNSDTPNTHEIYLALYTALPGVGTDYQFMSGNGVNAGLVQLLTPHPLG